LQSEKCSGYWSHSIVNGFNMTELLYTKNRLDYKFCYVYVIIIKKKYASSAFSLHTVLSYKATECPQSALGILHEQCPNQLSEKGQPPSRAHALSTPHRGVCVSLGHHHRSLHQPGISLSKHLELSLLSPVSTSHLPLTGHVVL
jgi:hypothetical protein